MKKLSKKERQDALLTIIDEDPFLTDELLSQKLNVSIQTIRLDRLEKNIPELRERIKDVAEKSRDEVKALKAEEVIGDIIELQLDKVAISILDIEEEHVFYRNKIARGHFLFAQGNSLCVALLDDALALTAKSEVKFIRPVKLGERVVAKATLLRKSGNRAVIEVVSAVKQHTVFIGTFEMYYSDKGESNG